MNKLLLLNIAVFVIVLLIAVTSIILAVPTAGISLIGAGLALPILAVQAVIFYFQIFKKK